MNSSKSWIKRDLSFGSQHCLKIFWCGFDDPSFLRPIFGATCHSTAISSGLLGESLHFQWWGEERASRGTHFFKILRRWFFHDWWRGCWNFLIKVVHFITRWTSHESMWLRTFVGEIGFTSSEKLRQESDKFVGIDMDVKEILLNGYQIKAAKEFCNQGAYLKPLTRAMVTSWLHHLLRDIYKQKIAQRYIYIIFKYILHTIEIHYKSHI